MPNPSADTHLDFDRVHIYERHGSSEVLVRTNLYKIFERREDVKDRTSNLSAYFVQGGNWYDRGGTRLEIGEVPEWVWGECRAMKAIDRAMYRILLPEEIAAGMTVPKFEEQAEYPPASSVMQALVGLDPNDDTCWTTQGQPAVEAVSKALGVRVTRHRLDVVAPRYVRPV